MLKLDDDLAKILKRVAACRRDHGLSELGITESDAYSTIVWLILELQEKRDKLAWNARKE